MLCCPKFKLKKQLKIRILWYIHIIIYMIWYYIYDIYTYVYIIYYISRIIYTIYTRLLISKPRGKVPNNSLAQAPALPNFFSMNPLKLINPGWIIPSLAAWINYQSLCPSPLLPPLTHGRTAERQSCGAAVVCGLARWQII